MKLAVCLLTADRPLYTAVTVSTFAKWNRGDRFIKLHGDDASADGANQSLAREYGFESVCGTNERRGQGHVLRHLWTIAKARGATHILHLENDWEWVKPLWFETLGFQNVRLYGAFKERDESGERSATGLHIIGTKEKIKWSSSYRPFDDTMWEHAPAASWGGPPSITEIDLLLAAVKTGSTIKDISLALPRLTTLRPVENLVYHIGEKQTENFNGRGTP